MRDVNRDYQSPLYWFYFINNIFHISLANAFILAIAIWPLVGYNVQAPPPPPRYNLKASFKNLCFFLATEETTI